MEAHYDQFIGLYPNAVPAEVCNKVINYFNEMNSLGKGYNRKEAEGVGGRFKKDVAVEFNPTESVTFTDQDSCMKVVSEYLANCVWDYREEYAPLEVYQMSSLYHKVQKTLPGGGYHVWHHEHAAHAWNNRVLTYTLYLNDVEHGGETEFLYQNVRLPARRGDICIFPAYFTHPHRGNPPLSGEKYIMTGWIESIAIPEGLQLIPK